MPVSAATDSEIVEALQRLVDDAITPGTYVILDADEGRNYYVQFCTQEGALWCEAVCNTYLEDEHKLDAAQLATLHALGWADPDHREQNLWQVFDQPDRETLEAIPTLVRAALTAAYGLPPDAPLTMRRSWDGQVLTRETTLTFASEAHRSTYEMVAGVVDGRFDRTHHEEHDTAVWADADGVLVRVEVQPYAIHSTAVAFFCPLATGLHDPDGELSAWIARKAAEPSFGALGLDADGDPVLHHALVGDTLTPYELTVVLASFAETAGELAAELAETFGAPGDEDE